MDLRPLVPATLALALGCAQSVAEPTLEPSDQLEAADDPATLAESEPGMGVNPDGGDAATPCEAALEDDEVALFGGKLHMRPPLGVSFDPARNSVSASAAQTGPGAAECDATLFQLNVALFENDAEKSLDEFAAQFVEALESAGIASSGIGSPPLVETDENHHLVIEFPPAKDRPAMMGYFAIVRRGDHIATLWFEAEPEDFDLLWPTFQASAKTVRE